MNVLLIIVDALRFDHLGIGGYNRNTSPNIDRIAKDGTIFLNAYTVLPRSDPAVTSMFTGLYPHSHGIRLILNKKVPENIATLAQILSSHGYKTGFIKPGSIPPEGYEKGFEDFDLISWKAKNKIKRGLHKILNKPIGIAEQHLHTARKWIEKNKFKKFFLVVHTNDLHWPYPIPKPFDHIFDSDYKGNHDYDTNLSSKYTRGQIIFGHANLPKEEISHAIAHYDGGIKYIDEQIGNLFDFMEKDGILDKTLIILVSDHGEHFGEHGYYFQHGASVYEPSIRSTLIFHNKSVIPRGKKILGRVQILDIMPTVLDLLKITLVEDIEGFSLVPLMKGDKDNVRDCIFVESAEDHFKGNTKVFFKGNKGKWRALVYKDWKLIYIPHPEKDIFELYNLAEDKEENNNLIDAQKEVAEELKKKLFDIMKKPSADENIEIEDLSAKSRKLLVKVGYLDSDKI